jgi:hypothetical protein
VNVLLPKACGHSASTFGMRLGASRCVCSMRKRALLTTQTHLFISPGSVMDVIAHSHTSHRPW